jgi:hypothetical protein
MVAAMARLARITQGERIFTLREKWPALKHHAGMSARKSSNSGNCPTLWDIKSGRRLSSYQLSREYHGKISKASQIVI